MVDTVFQLRLGVTRNGGFVYRTCVRSRTHVTAGRAPYVLCPIDDPAAPDCWEFFRIDGSTCVLHYRTDWPLTMYRDGLAVDGESLLQEGTAVVAGNRARIRLAPGSRGALYLGPVRLLFKWEQLPGDVPGEVPPRDIGEAAQCHACGAALADALVREGLLSRCSACRAMNRFLGPEARRSGTPPEVKHAAGIESDEGDTEIGLPLFDPVTRNRLEPLPPYLRPAGTAAKTAAASSPMAAAAGMRTVFGRSPFLGKRPRRRASLPNPVVDAVPLPDDDLARRAPRPVDDEPPSAGGDGPPDVERPSEPEGPSNEGPESPSESGDVPALDRAFYTAEVEALDWGGSVIPWATHSALSARSDFEVTDGRVPRASRHRPPPPSVSASGPETDSQGHDELLQKVLLVSAGAVVGSVVTAVIGMLL